MSVFPLISRIPIGSGQENFFEASYVMPCTNVVKSSKDGASLFCSWTGTKSIKYVSILSRELKVPIIFFKLK